MGEAISKITAAGKAHHTNESLILVRANRYHWLLAKKTNASRKSMARVCQRPKLNTTDINA